MKSGEDRTAYWYRELEKTHDALYSDIQRQRDRIKDLEAWLANNQAELISELRDTITTLEEAVDVASWTESRQNQEIRRLEEMVDSKNILEMEESLAQLRKRNFLLSAENCILYDEVDRLSTIADQQNAVMPSRSGKHVGLSSVQGDDILCCFFRGDSGRGKLFVRPQFITFP
jgi:predicted RNase H-like nuclease (RuvC/YqgF family)